MSLHNAIMIDDSIFVLFPIRKQFADRLTIYTNSMYVLGKFLLFRPNYFNTPTYTGYMLSY